jgi:hypothetical protein
MQIRKKGGMKIKKKFSSETTEPISNFAEMILGWSGRIAGHIFGRESSNDYFIKMLLLLSKWFQTKDFYGNHGKFT